jgi:hypothetical protein
LGTDKNSVQLYSGRTKEKGIDQPIGKFIVINIREGFWTLCMTNAALLVRRFLSRTGVFRDFSPVGNYIEMGAQRPVLRGNELQKTVRAALLNPAILI